MAGTPTQDSPEVLPSLIEFISANESAGFHSLSPSPTGTEIAAVQSPITLSESQRIRAVSISMPTSPKEYHLQSTKSVFFKGDDDETTTFDNEIASSSAKPSTSDSKTAKLQSQTMPTNYALFDEATASENSSNLPQLPRRNPRSDTLKDERFDPFKTWSRKLESQLSCGKPLENVPESNILPQEDVKILPVHRFFDALEGPELDTLRDSEVLLLPVDKQWPFLLRCPIACFGVCLGISSQAVLWKAMATSAPMKFLHVSLNVNLILWCISVLLTAIVSFIYSLKVIFYFEAVRREYYHPIRVNFFFAPWITLLFLALAVPPSIARNLPAALWYVLMTPIFCLELKIYGQWMSGGERRLSKVANPSNHLSVIGNFVGALLGASMGLKEGPIFFFAVGLAHYTVLFVTLYQRLPTNETLPRDLHPVFFLFVAGPSVASMAWARIQGSFDNCSRIAYFIALFLLFSLAVRVNFFRGFRFSLAWWAYTSPLTGASNATIKYSNEVTNAVTKSLALILCTIATLTVAALLVTTIFHACVLHDLFPNDVAIAISNRRLKTSRKWYHKRPGSSHTKVTENSINSANSDGNDIEASPSTSVSSITREARKSGLAEEVHKSHPQ